jgi:hypothetical protein
MIFSLTKDIASIQREAIEQYKRELANDAKFQAEAKIKRDEEEKRLENERKIRLEATMAELDAARETGGQCSFNFGDSEIIPFSVERVKCGTIDEHTIIGYYFRKDLKNAEDRNPEDNKKIIHEWHFFCSRENHARLLAEWSGNTESSKPKQLLKD